MNPLRNPSTPGAGTRPPRLEVVTGYSRTGSGDIATVYGANGTSAAPLRPGLIAKGMMYSPAHGDIALTVPLTDAFVRREMPERSHV